jgi:hypothetical protein
VSKKKAAKGWKETHISIQIEKAQAAQYIASKELFHNLHHKFDCWPAAHIYMKRDLSGGSFFLFLAHRDRVNQWMRRTTSMYSRRE